MVMTVQASSPLFDCLTEAVRCMAAVTALFFSLTMVGVTLMTMMNGW